MTTTNTEVNCLNYVGQNKSMCDIHDCFTNVWERRVRRDGLGRTRETTPLSLPPSPLPLPRCSSPYIALVWCFLHSRPALHRLSSSSLSSISSASLAPAKRFSPTATCTSSVSQHVLRIPGQIWFLFVSSNGFSCGLAKPGRSCCRVV